MGETKTAIYYNHNFYYDFSQIISADNRAIQFGDGAYEWIRITMDILSGFLIIPTDYIGPCAF